MKWGMDCHSPWRFFLCISKCEGLGLNEIDFCHRLLSEQEVAVVPGTAFGDHGKNHVRASFSTSYDKLVEAADRMERFVDTVTFGSRKRICIK